MNKQAMAFVGSKISGVTGDKKILIIEDDAEIRETLTEILQMEGYAVHSVKNGQEGIDYLRTSSPPALILLDYMMPVMNGGQFRTVQKEDPKLSKIPVVVLSADSSVFQKSDVVGVHGFLRKPIELERLLSMIKVYC